jgi:hypothetical protein
MAFENCFEKVMSWQRSGRRPIEAIEGISGSFLRHVGAKIIGIRNHGPFWKAKKELRNHIHFLLIAALQATHGSMHSTVGNGVRLD